MLKKKSHQFITILISAVLLVQVIATITSPAASSSQTVNSTNSGWSAYPMIHISPLATSSPTGLSPSQIRAVYNLPSTGGSGTIAIIDAYDAPTIVQDLSVFSAKYGLPAANFEKHMMSSSLPTDSGWALEASLDVEWAHAIAPNAKILLIESASASLNDLLNAINYANSRADVVAISMSWGGSEFSSEASYDNYFTSNHGAVFFASSGDSGAGTMWPAVSPNVVSVGGTTLNFKSDGTLASETAWYGSGGGVSMYEREPSYQLAYGIPNTNGFRAMPDVSYDANPTSGVAVYDTTPYGSQSGWFQVGGTSAGSPQWAAIQSLGLSASDSNLYKDAKSSYSSYFRDITSGTSGYSAGTGYDLVTGLGSPLTINYATSTTPDFTMLSNPNTMTVQPGNSTTSIISVSSINGFSGSVSLQVSSSSNTSDVLSLQSLLVSSGGSNSSTVTITVQSNAPAGTYTVTVTGTSGSLSHSAIITVIVPAKITTSAPSAPQNLIASAGNAQIMLSWLMPSSNGNSSITQYTIYRGTSSGAETKLATTNALAYVDTTAQNGQIYYYRVTATNGIGESAKSNEASATPSSTALGSSLTVTITTNKPAYDGKGFIYITAYVKDGNGNPVQGAKVKFTITDTNSTNCVWIFTFTTGSDGSYKLNFVTSSTLKGIYDVSVKSSMPGYTSGIGDTTFSII